MPSFIVGRRSIIVSTLNNVLLCAFRGILTPDPKYQTRQFIAQIYQLTKWWFTILHFRRDVLTQLKQIEITNLCWWRKCRLYHEADVRSNLYIECAIKSICIIYFTRLPVWPRIRWHGTRTRWRYDGLAPNSKLWHFSMPQRHYCFNTQQCVAMYFPW